MTMMMIMIMMMMLGMLFYKCVGCRVSVRFLSVNFLLFACMFTFSLGESFAKHLTI